MTELPVTISTAGTTRSPVVVIGPLALKFAKNEQGRLCNLYRRTFTAGPMKCAVPYCVPCFGYHSTGLS
jgi:hypothetical protein